MRSVALAALAFAILYQGKNININSKKLEQISGELSGPCCDAPSSCQAVCIYNEQPDSRFGFTKGLLPVTCSGKGKVKSKYLTPLLIFSNFFHCFRGSVCVCSGPTGLQKRAELPNTQHCNLEPS